MIHRITIVALLLVFAASTADAQNRKYRRRGVILGGLAGAAIGVAIGDKGNNETAGALIGAAAGAMAGGAIGNQKDQRLEHYQQYPSPYAPIPRTYRQPTNVYRGYGSGPSYFKPHYYGDSLHTYPPPTMQAPSVLITPEQAPITATDRTETRAVSTADVISMVKAGISDTIILQQIRLRGIASNPTVREIIELHQMGVSESVIAEMQVDVDSSIQELPAPTGFPVETN